ncbi:TRAP transporter large permease [Frigidibacter sp. MR17.14]|uniref:TRAP transporter large permease n=1 Tax=Frigidibacter sp. MR17.14 TaxID=3126509 RepID=UPI003012A236
MILILATFTFALALGIPVAISLGLSSISYLLAHGHLHLLLAMPQRMIAGIDSFVLLTIPLFILAGNLMNAANLTQQIVRFAQMLVGRLRGGLAVVNVISSLLFAGVSGAATAEASAIGSVMVPAMVRDGYRPAYAAALTAVGSLLGPMIPPSLSLVLYGALTGTSIGDLFLAGIGPAFALAGLLTLYVLWRARAENHPAAPLLPRHERRAATVGAIPAMLLPVIIVGGIRGGIFTPTEAAAVACVYALLIGGLLYRSLSLREIERSFFETATMSAGIMLVIAMASVTAFVMGIENIPQKVAAAMLSVSETPAVLILMLNLLLLVLGLFLEPMAAMILIMPILAQVTPLMGLDPVQMGIMIVLNLMIGMVTPPVGLVLFIVGAIARVSLEEVTRAALPLIGLAVLVLFLTVAAPPLTLFLPSLLK